MTVRRYEMSDEQWKQIKDMFPRAKTGRPPKDNRIMFNAILWIARSGSAWRNLPERYGAYQTVYSRFCKRYDKLASSFLAFIYVVSILILSK